MLTPKICNLRRTEWRRIGWALSWTSGKQLWRECLLLWIQIKSKSSTQRNWHQYLQWTGIVHSQNPSKMFQVLFLDSTHMICYDYIWILSGKAVCFSTVQSHLQIKVEQEAWKGMVRLCQHLKSRCIHQNILLKA